MNIVFVIAFKLDTDLQFFSLWMIYWLEKWPYLQFNKN